MNNFTLLAALAGLELFAIGIPVLILRQMNRRARFDDRLASVLATVRPRMEKSGRLAPGAYVRSMIGGVGGALLKSGVISPETLQKLETTVEGAGFRGGAGLQIFMGSKFLTLSLVPLLVWSAFHTVDMPFAVRALLIFGAAVLGLLLPDFVVGWLHGRHLRALEAGLPDALDMMVICAEAGMGLEHTLARVAQELFVIQPQVSIELEAVSNEIRVLSDRRLALKNMGERTGLDSFKRIGSTLVQSLQYGTPLAGSLRNLASELREEAHTRFEGRAARLPVLLTLPMIGFILPCLFLIVGGPAGLQIARVLFH